METKNAFLAGSCREFADKIASSDPTPGGGGAAAYCGAMGAGLLVMVGRCTVGKKTYADVEAEVQQLIDQVEALRHALLGGVEEDAAAFAPLAAAYALPAGTEAEKAAKRQRLAECSLSAAKLPLHLAALCGEGLGAAARLAQIGGRLVISDAACGAAILLAAQKSLAVTVRINLGALLAAGGEYAAFAARAEAQLAELLSKGEELERQAAAAANERMF